MGRLDCGGGLRAEGWGRFASLINRKWPTFCVVVVVDQKWKWLKLCQRKDEHTECEHSSGVDSWVGVTEWWKRGRRGEGQRGRGNCWLVGVTDNLMKMTLLYITLCANWNFHHQQRRTTVTSYFFNFYFFSFLALAHCHAQKETDSICSLKIERTMKSLWWTSCVLKWHVLVSNEFIIEKFSLVIIKHLKCLTSSSSQLSLVFGLPQLREINWTLLFTLNCCLVFQE